MAGGREYLLVERHSLGEEFESRATEVLGYLNFSSGARDLRFLANLNVLAEGIESRRRSPESGFRSTLKRYLRELLASLRERNETFRRCDQAEAVLDLVFEHFAKAYRRFHKDLLFHQPDRAIFRPFLLGRACEAVLSQGPPWADRDRIIGGAIAAINDFIGYRPVAVLHSRQKIKPYAHEWVAPIPLYLKGVGAAAGRYRALVERAVAILDATDSAELFQAMFDPGLLDELAMDPRAYDFDHPVNKRPNYLFGTWDFGVLDGSGYARRYVVQQVTLDGLMDRVEGDEDNREERMFEAAAALAGTILMGSGISGNRPDAHDSTVSLATLVQRVADYRDRFYERLLERMQGPHGRRLREEAERLRQPFGGVRQHLNQYVAERRARQLQHVHLAHFFAQMGHFEAAEKEAARVPVAVARMRCELHCRLRSIEADVRRGRLAKAAAALPAAENVLHRAIECGAMADPWNILGFAGQFSLFPSPENSVRDHRIDELIGVVKEIFRMHAALLKAAAARGDEQVARQCDALLERLANWWDQYGSTEVADVEGFSGKQAREAAMHVAAALREWHEAGTASGNLAFWRGKVERFQSAGAYAMVVRALLEQNDLVAAMALLVQWLSQAERLSLLAEGETFHALAIEWMRKLWREQPESGAPRDAQAVPPPWQLSCKFLDYLEANAESYGEVPSFLLAGAGDGADAETKDETDEDRPGGLYQAAYEAVTYRDSTDDGVDGSIFDRGAFGSSPGETDLELVNESDRVMQRVGYHVTLAHLWRIAAIASLDGAGADAATRDEVLSGWLRQARESRRRMIALLRAVHAYRIQPPRGTQDSLVEYDRRRTIKETLLGELIDAYVEIADSECLIHAAMAEPAPEAAAADWDLAILQALRALIRGQRTRLRRQWSRLIRVLLSRPLLYVSLEKGGSPVMIAAARGLHRVIARLLEYLPRLGMLREACGLIDAVQEMELDHPVGPGATTEFDRLFEIGCKGIARCLVASIPPKQGNGQSQILVERLEDAVEVLLRSWLSHSQGVRLSVLEQLDDSQRWRMLKQFIVEYGADLFTQKFMNLGNLRAILHQGVAAWLESAAKEPELRDLKLVAELDRRIPRDEAARWLALAIEAVVENYQEYVDYNTTTTQSDHGDQLYTLLDFLRLKARYDRIAWNLRPVVLAHEVLVRAGREMAAEIWRQMVLDRTENTAAQFLEQLKSLVLKHGMRLRSVRERLAQRFIRPLDVDRLRALVRPALRQLRAGKPGKAVANLLEKIDEFASEPAGAGFEAPQWLEAIVEELHDAESDAAESPDSLEPYLALPQVTLSPAQLQRELRAMLGE